MVLTELIFLYLSDATWISYQYISRSMNHSVLTWILKITEEKPLFLLRELKEPEGQG